MLLNTAVKNVKRLSHRGDQTVTTDTITSDIVANINDARRDLVKYIPKRFLHKQATSPLSLVSGTAVYSLASDVLEPIVFRWTLNNTLYLPRKVESDREWFENVYSPSQANTIPRHYRELGPSSALKRVEFFPTPDQTISCDYEYYKDPCGTDLTTSDLSSEIPDFPGYMHDALWKGGLYYFIRGFDDSAGTMIAKQDYNECIMALDKLEDADQDSDMSMRFGLFPNQDRGQNGMRIY
jgi:hypothetical protein